MPVDFILGEMPKLRTAAETGGFLTSRMLSHCPFLNTVGKVGGDCTPYPPPLVLPTRRKGINSPATTAVPNVPGWNRASIAVTFLICLDNSAQFEMKGLIFLIIISARLRHLETSPTFSSGTEYKRTHYSSNSSAC